MQFKEIAVDLPKHDCDVVIRFPGGKELIVQARPSNADVNSNGSLDFVLPQDQVVTCWKGDDMESAPPASDHMTKDDHIRVIKQMATELPGDYR